MSLTDLAVIHALETLLAAMDVHALMQVRPFGGGGVSAQKMLQALRLTGVRAYSNFQVPRSDRG